MTLSSPPLSLPRPANDERDIDLVKAVREAKSALNRAQRVLAIVSLAGVVIGGLAYIYLVMGLVTPLKDLCPDFFSLLKNADFLRASCLVGTLVILIYIVALALLGGWSDSALIDFKKILSIPQEKSVSSN